MIGKLLGWLDDRTGYQEILQEALYEKVPGGARWRYVWGSTLVFTFVLQVITGFFLWTAYSPSAQTAWESVFYIQHHMVLGSVIRGIHHYAAQAMVILLAIHLIQVIVDGAYRAPREVNFWLGLILMQIVLGLALTGYLLPWDQKGYYATQVATKIAGAAPAIGPAVQTIVQGGKEYGHHTLTRFFALHAGLLPASLVGFLALHLAVFRRHGITVPDPDHAPDTTFWPDQVFRDAVACLGVLAVVLLLAVFRGAELAAPANPSEAYAAARPEWYFLFLFRFLKFEAVEHFGVAFGAIYVPGAIMGVIALMPIIALVKGGHRFNVLFMSFIAVAAAALTAVALYEDSTDIEHKAAVAEARRDAHRIEELANLPTKIPVTGALSLLQEDPYTQGPRIFAKHCKSCHHYNGHDGRGRIVMIQDPEAAKQNPETKKTVPAKPTAVDLGNFGSRDWMRSVLVDYSNHFAALKNADWYKNGDGEILDPDDSEMADWSGDHESLMSDENKDNLNAIVEYLVSETGRADLKADAALATKGDAVALEGAWNGAIEGTSCTDCHESMGSDFDPDLGDTGGYPDIAEYGSAKWLKAFISNPGSDQFYGSKNHMPAYAEKMTSEELDLLVRWMTGDYSNAEHSN